MKKILAFFLSLLMILSFAACAEEESVLVYGSGDYTRINPAMDEHGEINLLIFSGLTAHDGENKVIPALAESWEFDEDACIYTFFLRKDVKWHDGENQVIPALAESWEYDEATFTYTFRLRKDVKWHDGESFTAEDVKFTIEAIMNP